KASGKEDIEYAKNDFAVEISQTGSSVSSCSISVHAPPEQLLTALAADDDRLRRHCLLALHDCFDHMADFSLKLVQKGLRQTEIETARAMSARPMLSRKLH